MASSEGLASLEPWSLRQSLGVDSWLLPESTFSRDSDLLTRALHKSISTSHHHNTLLLPDLLSPSPFLDSSAIFEPSPPPPSVPALSTVSGGSDPESTSGKRKGNGALGIVGSRGKPSKRRSRASKKSQTTFITADPENFRQMVQQITGAKYINSSHNIFDPVVKPEAHRLASRVSSDRSGLPTLDTSAFLSSSVFSSGLGSSAISVTAEAETGGSTVELENYFPTLESWKVM